MLHVVEINHIEQLTPFQDDWRRLLARTPRATFFQSLDWLTVYWQHYGAGQKLRVLILSNDGQVQGILPLVVRTEATKAGPLRFLTYPLDSWGSDYGPIGPDSEATLRTGLHHLRRTRRDWDVLELRWVADGEAARAAESAFGDCRLSTRRAEMVPTAVIDFAGSWDGYLAGRTSKWRNNFRRWQRRLLERGSVEHVRFRPRGSIHGDGDPRWDLYDACEDVASRSWQTVDNQSTGTTLSSAAIRPFLRAVHERAAALGCVDLNLLRLNGEAVAFAYNYHYAGQLYGLRVGYDASLARDGAGNLLYAQVIEDSFRRGDTRYDMGPGSLECKQYLWTSTERLLRYSHYPATAWRAQLVRLKRHLAARPSPPAALESPSR